MKNLLKKFNILVFILSLVIAVLLWGYVSFYLNPEGEKTVNNIPVRFNNDRLEANGLIMVSDRSQTVSVRLTGRIQYLSGLNEGNLEAVVQLTNVTGAGEFELNYELNTVDAGVAVQLTYLDHIKLTQTVPVSVDNLIKRQVPVELAEDPSGDAGYLVESELIDPSAVEVTGPSRFVSGIERAFVTYQPDARLTATTEEYCGFTLHTAEGQIATENMRFLTLDTDEVLLRIPVSKVKEVFLDIRCIDGGGITKEANIKATINPRQVWIAGPPDVVDTINTVYLFETFDLAQLKGDTTATYQIQYPDGVRSLDNVTAAEASIEIMNADTREIITSGITPTVNVADGFAYRLITKSLGVTIRGSYSEVVRVLPYNISVRADFGESPLTEGVHHVEPVITLNGFEGTVGIVDTDYAVSVEVYPEQPPSVPSIGGDES
ncbi:MAG: hypothetical protein LBR72_07500 [Oscillospiraceae bacterium]|jgi:YbbR domain-containing protein|nr:hypothetical protein [Oscillospiraceae bacterium]